MHKLIEKRIETLHMEIELAKKLEKYVEIASEYKEKNPERKVSISITEYVFIYLNVDDIGDLEGIREAFIKVGEKFDQPEYYNEQKCFASSSQHTIINGIITGKSCKIVQTGTKEVPVYDVKCEEEDA